MTDRFRLPDWPAAALIGSTVPKQKLAQGSSTPTAVRAALARDVERVTWVATLSPERVNLSAGTEVPEFVVLSLELRSDDVEDRLLDQIDRAIPHLVIFELRRHRTGHAEIRVAAFLGSRGVGSSHCLASSPWGLDDGEHASMPVATDLEALYLAMLRPLLPVAIAPGSRPSGVAETIAHVKTLERRIATQLRIERGTGQFNRRAEARHQRCALEAERDALIAGHDHKDTPWND